MTTSTGPQRPTRGTTDHAGTARPPRTAHSGHAPWGQVVPGPLAASVAQEGARRRRRRGAVLVVVLAVATWFGVQWAQEAVAGWQAGPSGGADTSPDGAVVGSPHLDGPGVEPVGGDVDEDAPAPPRPAGDDEAGDDARVEAVVAELTAAGIDPELARRYARADAAAAAEGVDLVITSGRRTAAEQQRLVDDAVARYGSLAEARRWVLPPDRSAHVTGHAIDVGRTEGALWLGQHGQAFGLCRVYANEIWHFELLPDGAERCPVLLPDSSSGW